MDDVLQQHPIPGLPAPPEVVLPSNPGYVPCAGGPCDFNPILPFFTPVPGSVPDIVVPRPSFTPRPVFEEFATG